MTRKFKSGIMISRVAEVQPMLNKVPMLMKHDELTVVMDLQAEAEYLWMRKQHRLLNRVENRDLEVEVLIGSMDSQRRIESDSGNPEQESQEDAGKLITSVSTACPII